MTQYLEQQFAKDGYRVTDLMRRIAESDVFVTVKAPPAKSAHITSPDKKEQGS